MKMKILVTLLLLMLAGTAAAQDENVISYYAVGNSMDGQPQIGDQNLLRFYPIFAMREYVDTVLVTVYYGPHVYSRFADKYDNGRYWQVLLPKFELGESIQRVEVETAINLQTHPLLSEYSRVIAELEKAFAEFKKHLEEEPQVFEKAILQRLELTLSNLDSGLLKNLTARLNAERNAGLETGGHMAPVDDVEGLVCRLQAICRCVGGKDLCIDGNLRETFRSLVTKLDAYVKTTSKAPDYSVGTAKTEDEMVARFSAKTREIGEAEIDRVRTELPRLESAIRAQLPNLATEAVAAVVSNPIESIENLLLRLTHMRDSLRTLIANESYERLIDTMYAGPGVRKSDVIFDDATLARARILYRNYKLTLRTLPALDPAEKMGIFRARYVPFIVLGDDYTTPFTGDEAVFEIGLGFSNVSVASDDFIIPDFSLKRLGVAFAISSALFTDKADVRALALTYDFNSYGSLAFGANFPGSNGNRSATHIESYVSFGINKLAFEKMLTGLAGLFNR